MRSLHYWRIPRPYWQDRLRRVKALGLNTVQTCTPVALTWTLHASVQLQSGCAAADVHWGLHEASPNKYDFEQSLDLAAYLQLAQDESLHVILRAGPYICAEQSFGGLPWWLGSSQVRSCAHSRFDTTVVSCNLVSILVDSSQKLSALAGVEGHAAATTCHVSSQPDQPFAMQALQDQHSPEHSLVMHS